MMYSAERLRRNCVPHTCFRVRPAGWIRDSPKSIGIVPNFLLPLLLEGSLLDPPDKSLCMRLVLNMCIGSAIPVCQLLYSLLYFLLCYHVVSINLNDNRFGFFHRINMRLFNGQDGCGWSGKTLIENIPSFLDDTKTTGSAIAGHNGKDRVDIGHDELS
jgi:hypothetical protein